MAIVGANKRNEETKKCTKVLRTLIGLFDYKLDKTSQ